MRSLGFVGLVAVAAMLAQPASAAGESRGQRNWGNVPNLTLKGPDGVRHSGGHGGAGPGGWHQGGGWGQGGWNGGGQRRHYQRYWRGHVLPSYYIAPRYYINDWSGYGLGRPGYGQNWVRHYDDAYLVDGRGTIHDGPYWIDWDRYDHGPVPSYVGDGEGYGPDDDYYGDDMVTWGGRGYGGHYGGGQVVVPGGGVYHVPPGGTIVIVQQPGVMTTTTTTTTEYVKVGKASRVIQKKRAWKPGGKAALKPLKNCNCK